MIFRDGVGIKMARELNLAKDIYDTLHNEEFDEARREADSKGMAENDSKTVSSKIEHECKRICANIASYTNETLDRYVCKGLKGLMGLENLKADTSKNLVGLMELNSSYMVLNDFKSHPDYEPCTVKINHFITKLNEITDYMRGN